MDEVEVLLHIGPGSIYGSALHLNLSHKLGAHTVTSLNEAIIT